MRVALQVTCINDALFPDTGKAMVTLLRRLGVDVEFPHGPDVLRAADGQHRLPRRGGAGAAVLRRGVQRVRRHRHAVGVLCRVGAAPAPDRRRAGPATPSLVAAVEETAPRVFELTEFLVDELGVTDVGASFPHTVTYHPTCHSLRMLGVGDRPTDAARAGPRPAPRRPARRRGVLRVRRHLRDEERRHLDRHGFGQGAPRPRDRRRGPGRRRQLLPDAHRRPAVATALRGAHDAPRRDPGSHRERTRKAVVP